MAAERPASSQQRSYADQYLGRGAKPHDPEAEPYGHWYAERLPISLITRGLFT